MRKNYGGEGMRFDFFITKYSTKLIDYVELRKILVFPLFLGIVFNTSFLYSQEGKLYGSLSISGAWAIYPTAVAWAERFQEIHPRVKINISAGGAGKGVSDVIAGFVDIGMVSREPDKSEIEKGIIPIYILHDAVFPIVSEKNPYLQNLMKKGIKRDVWIEIYIDGKAKNWSQILGISSMKPLHIYTRSDSCGAGESWAKYLGAKQEDLKGIGIYGDPGIIEAVKRDPLSIGYCNFSYVFERDGSILKGIEIVPIDLNSNGVADREEIIKNREEAVKAINENKYPVRRKNYFFVRGKPTGLLKEFIMFVLSEEGTKIVEKVGTSLPLPKDEREKIIKSLE